MRRREPSYTVGGNVSCTATMENSMEFPQKTKNRITIWSSNPTPGHISRQNSNTCTPMFIAALFTIAKKWKQPKLSIDRWMDKEDVVHIYNGILLSHKKEWNNAICSNIDGPRDYYTKWSMSDKDNIWYHSYVDSN